MNTMRDTTRGTLIREFRPFVSFQNKTFLGVWVAAIVLLPLDNWIKRDFVMGAIATSWVITIPLLYLGFVAWSDSHGRTLFALYENGLEWRGKGMRGFVPWSHVVSVDEKRARRGGIYWEVVLRDGEARGVIIAGAQGGLESVDFIRGHALAM